MRALIIFLFILPSFATDIPIEEFFHFVETGQNRLLAPKFTEIECHELPKGAEEEKFDAAKCIKDICSNQLVNPIDLNQLVMGHVMSCAVEGKASLDLQICTDTTYQKHYPEIRKIADKMKDFYLAELKLTGHRIKAAVKFMKSHENPNSPLDNFGLNMMDLWTFMIEHPNLIKVEEKDGSLNVKLKNEKSIKRKLRWRFNLKRGAEDKAAYNAIKAVFEDSNSLMALEILGPDYVLKNFMDSKGIRENPDVALRKLKFEALGKLQHILGKDTIDPEYVEGTSEEASVDRSTLLAEVLVLQNLTSKLSSNEMSILSKANFPRKRFYNRSNFERDWTNPLGDTYISTLKHLEELSKLYVGDNETFNKHDIYPYLNAMLAGLALLPEKDAVDDIKKKVPGFINQFFDSFQKQFSKESTNLIRGEVGKLHINYPQNKEEFLEKINDWLDYRKSQADKGLEQLRDDKNKKAVAYYGRQYIQTLLQGRGADGGLGELLPLVAVNPIPDLYIGAYNGIKMGPYAVNEFEGGGKQVLAHELGHHVGHFMEDNPLSKTSTGKFKVVR